MPTAALTADERKIAVYTRYQDKERIQLIPGVRRNARDGCWELPASWASCVLLRGVFGADLDVHESLRAWSWEVFNHRVVPTLELKSATEYGDVGDDRLRPYQRAGVQWLVTAGSGLLADDMGSGKTVQVSSALRLLGPDALPALVICPNSMKHTWARELSVWAPDADPYVITGTAAKRRKEILAATDNPHAVIVINMEAVRSFSRLAPYGNVALRKCRTCDPHQGEEDLKPTQCHKHPKELNAINFRTVVFDEAHRMQDPKSQQTRATWAVMHAPGVVHRWALTGTPIGTARGSTVTRSTRLPLLETP
jgi:SNF2 family DNA or RNA helicase